MRDENEWINNVFSRILTGQRKLGIFNFFFSR